MFIALALILALASIITLAGIGCVLAAQPAKTVTVYDQASDSRYTSHLHNTQQ